MTLDPSQPPRVIAIRSIGTGLGAVVAARLGARTFWTVRPTGHPFARSLSLHPDIEVELVSADATYVVVDEGPGLSGSSFGAVADYLEARGVPRARIAFLPSHGGDLGPHASDAHRARWADARRPVADVQSWLPDRLTEWAVALLGPLEAPLRDISGGAWRQDIRCDEQAWPAVDPSQERLKYRARARARDAEWLLKFVGIGAVGEGKLVRARQLHAAGFVPEPVGLLHGFLVQRWVEAEVAGEADAALIAFAGEYFGTRARLFPAGAERGASCRSLFDMARYNIATALGEDWAAHLDPWAGMLPELETRVTRVEVDGRCERHEWLGRLDGGFLKADALDHHAGHDLIGCQDIGWDVAGFAIEFDLDDAACERLIESVEAASGQEIDRLLLAWLRPCYLAFRLGQRQLTASGLDGWPDEQRRNLAARDRYARKLRRLLAVPLKV